MKPRTTTLALPLTLLLGLLPGAATAQSEARGALRWQLKVDDVHHYAFTWELAMGQKVLGGDQPMEVGGQKILVSFTLAEKVTAVGEDGVASIEAMVTSIKASMEAKMMGMPMPKRGYDSLDPQSGEGAPILKVLGQAVGKPIRFKLSPQGKVSAVTGGAAIQKAVEEAALKEMERQGMGGMGGGMGGGNPVGTFVIAFADKTLESTLNALNYVLPDAAKSKGDEWSRPLLVELPPLGSLSATCKYRHDGSHANGTRISYKADGAPKLNRSTEKGDESPAAAMQRELFAKQQVKESKLKGLATFGPGKLADSEVTLELVTEGDLPEMLKAQLGGEGGKMGLTIGLTLRYELQAGPPKPKAEGKSSGF